MKITPTPSIGQVLIQVPAARHSLNCEGRKAIEQAYRKSGEEFDIPVAD
tara:strand:+ start:421 stop:567 length:147 start_codon:yes stop_codon:yes gene_type:complete